MMKRRIFALAIALAAGFGTAPAFAYDVDPLTRQPLKPIEDGRAKASPITKQEVDYSGPHKAGTILVSTAERRLYLVLPGNRALKYGVGVGRPGFEWGGTKTISRKAEWPDWRPPAQMRKRRPDLPAFMPGGPQNPLGARAMYLGSSLYRIHGSNEPETIGQAVSSGCIRMMNEEVIDLYDRVQVGAAVVVEN
jgi:lipoprotein-anchoring transpeptidase ErfK/SrfK